MRRFSFIKYFVLLYKNTIVTFNNLVNIKCEFRFIAFDLFHKLLKKAVQRGHVLCKDFVLIIIEKSFSYLRTY